jgi:biopolymer transport protein TolR
VSMSGSGNGGFRRRGDLPVNAEINITSLVDVAFTLLVIFIIAAPSMLGGVEVAVPKAQVQPLTTESNPFYITVTRDGTVFVEKTQMTPEEFEHSFPQLAKAGTFKIVYIRGDSLASWGPMLKVIATVSSTGVKFGMVGQPYNGKE